MPPVREILPDVLHWEAFHEPCRARVSSYYIGGPAGIVIDPKLPEDAFDGFPSQPEQVVLTNGNHLRDAQSFAERFGIPVRAPREAADKLDGEVDYEPYDDHDLVAVGVTAVRIGKLAQDEYALYLDVADGAIAFADALNRYSGVLAFGSDTALGDKAPKIKAGLKQAFEGLLLRDFENLLFSHGEPLVGDGKAALRRFVKSPVGHEEFGNVL
jgi:hypothetical protein